MRSLDKTYNLSTNFADTDTRDASRYARRVAAKDDAELRAVLANGATRPVSAAHALRSLQVLAFACQEQLDRYPSSLVDDDARIGSGELEPFSNERNALVVVRGEKRICRMCVAAHATRCWCRASLLRAHRALELKRIYSFVCSYILLFVSNSATRAASNSRTPRRTRHPPPLLAFFFLPATRNNDGRYVDLAARAAEYLTLPAEERTLRVREDCDNPDDNICNAITRIDRDLLKMGR